MQRRVVIRRDLPGTNKAYEVGFSAGEESGRAESQALIEELREKLWRMQIELNIARMDARVDVEEHALARANTRFAARRPTAVTVRVADITRDGVTLAIFKRYPDSPTYSQDYLSNTAHPFYLAEGQTLTIDLER